MAEEIIPRAQWRQNTETKALQLFARGAETSSWDSCRVTGAWLGLFFFAAFRKRRAIATNNVRLAFPELGESAARQIARRSAQNFGMTACEFMHLRIASPEDVRERASIDGLEHVFECLSHGRGALLLTAHLGNWELMGARAAQEFPLSVVARPPSNAGIENHIAQVRRASGIEVISKYDTGRASLTALRQNRTLGILPDQHAKGPEGVVVPFFNHPARVITSLARLAILSGAPMIPSFGVRRKPWLRDGRIVAKVSPGIYLQKPKKRDPQAREEAVVEGTRVMVAELEKIIRAHPDQWLWMHKRWRSQDDYDNGR